jgi:hypothetical protein
LFIRNLLLKTHEESGGCRAEPDRSARQQRRLLAFRTAVARRNLKSDRAGRRAEGVARRGLTAA